MKRSVFILVLSLWGLQSPGNLSPGYTYLSSMPCDALRVNSRSFSKYKPSGTGRFNSAGQYLLSPLQSKRQKLFLASINTLAILPPEALSTELASGSLSQGVSKTNRYRSIVSNRFNNNIKVPP